MQNVCHESLDMLRPLFHLDVEGDRSFKWGSIFSRRPRLHMNGPYMAPDQVHQGLDIQGRFDLQLRPITTTSDYDFERALHRRSPYSPNREC